ncbi:MAG: hypothetical protein KatS3mg115_1065 [Candidatus Poribacteria bacterium]|nr:MAG: hypothetical protein KatS3mg115_1065 [Candidatus Poribacteria bacterium]
MPLRGLGGGTFHSRYLGELAGFQQGTPEHEALFTRYVRAIQDHLEAKGWLEKAYIYWFDEPEPKDYPFVREGMALIGRAGPKLTRMLTEEPVEELYGYVDLWCPITNHYDHQRAEERRQHGERFWWYICTGPKAPYATLFIDHPAVELRTWLWQTWKYKLDGILIWQSNYWTSPTAFPDRLQNPYEDPMSYQTGYGRPPGYIGYWGNGDGRFLYPPEEVFTGEGPVLEGPVSSIRWEMLREGIEDYEYLWLLRSAVERWNGREGLDPQAQETVRRAAKLLEVPPEITDGADRLFARAGADLSAPGADRPGDRGASSARNGRRAGPVEQLPNDREQEAYERGVPTTPLTRRTRTSTRSGSRPFAQPSEEDEIDLLALREAYYRGYQDGIADLEGSTAPAQQGGRPSTDGRIKESGAVRRRRGAWLPVWLGAGIGALLGVGGCLLLLPRQISGLEGLLAALPRGAGGMGGSHPSGRGPWEAASFAVPPPER